MKYFLIIIILLFSTHSFADLIKPSSNLNAYDVVSIQLNALKQNDIPYKNKYKNCCENINKKKYEYIFINNKDEKLWNIISFMFLNKDDFEIIPVHNKSND